MASKTPSNSNNNIHVITAKSSYDVQHDNSRKHNLMDKNDCVDKQIKKCPKAELKTFSVPEILCQCQQKCTVRVTAPLIQRISMFFYGMRFNREKQKRYLANLILGREKPVDHLLLKGKRVRKMSYRYFVPVLNDKDLAMQNEENIAVEQTLRGYRSNNKNNIYFNLNNNWDHIEVCLKAFTAIHVISEKRVIVTRHSCPLRSEIICTKPFGMHNHLLQGSSASSCHKSEAITKKASEAWLPMDWMLEYCQQAPHSTANIQSLLPEGLVLPDSIVCVPVFSKSECEFDANRDLDIINNFFCNQLWKPEYIGYSADEYK